MTSTGFYPQKTLADPAEIRRSAQGLRAITGALLGHGDSVGAVLREVALSFSELISSAVAAQIGNLVGALETAVEGTEYGCIVSTAWADDVEAYITARNELIYRWNLAEIDNFGVAPPLNLVPTPPADERERLDSEHRVNVRVARTDALDSFIAEGHQLWEAFQDKVLEKGRMFRDGPTAENLALLRSTLDWSAMTLWPGIAPPPVTAADGVTAGTTVIDGLDNTAGPQAVADALADVAAITRRAAAGQALTPAELDFLEAFYATMGPRITEVPDYLAQTSFEYTTEASTRGRPADTPLIYTTHAVDGLDPAMVGAMTAASANGLLVLSRTGPSGGGYERLPSWVRETLHDEAVPYPLPVGPDPEDYQSWLVLGEFLAHSDVAAGDGLSRELALATQRMVRSVDGFEDFSPDGSSTWGSQVDAAGQSFLDVIARNDGVSFDLVTGSNMPDEYDPARFFVDVYTFEWSDDGASAAGITDFIPGYALSSDPAQRAMADEAMGDLFDILTDPDTFTTLLDGVGNSGDAASSSLGQVNPEISAGLGRAMGAYLDSFGLPEGTEGAFGDPAMDARTRFVTLIMTNPEAGVELTEAVAGYNAESLGEVTDTVTAAELGVPAGRLLALLDAGAVNVVMDEAGDLIQDVEDEEEQVDIIIDLLGAAVAEVPGGGVLAELLDVVEDSRQIDDIPWPNVTDAVLADPQRRYDTMADVAESLRTADLLLTDLDPRLLDDSGAVRDFDELDGLSSDAARAMLEVAVEEALGLAPGDLLDELDGGYGELAESFPTSPEAYENRYEG